MTEKPTYEELEQRVKELEESEKDLVFRNKQLDSIVNNSGFGIVSLDKYMKVIRCNEAFEELFLYAKSEMEGKTLDELIADSNQVKKAREYTDTTLTGKGIQGSGQRRRKDGALIDVKFSGIPITVDGEVVGAYGIYEDITARKQAEDAVRKSDAEKKAILDASIDMIMLVDTELKMIWVNKTAAGMVNRNPEDLIGHACHKLFQNLDEPCPGCPTLETIESGKPTHKTDMAVTCQ